GVFAIQDDGPTAGTVVGTADKLILDESALGTDTAGGTAPTGLATFTANFADNFTSGSYGTDGAGTTKYTLTLNGVNVASGLYALDPTDVDPAHPGQGLQIVLNQSGDTISGTANNITYFTITINETTGDVTFTQLHNLWHPNTTNSDDQDNLTLAANTLQVVQTITDADGDHVSTPIDLSTGVFAIQDDGPTAGTVTGPTDTLVLDETRPVGTDTSVHTAPNGLATVTANFADNFTGGSYGTDGAGTTKYTLTLNGANVASGLYALDPTDVKPATGIGNDGDGIGQGTQIVLNQSGDTITGTANNITYFTITIDETTGVVTFAQVNNIWNPDPTNPDDPATLTLSNANLLQVVQTITDADGDHASAAINLGTGVFTIQDSGPTLIAETNLVYANSANGAGHTGGTGIYQYNIGTDAHTIYDSTHSDFAPITLTGTVGSHAISNQSVTWSSESATSAVFHVTFDYQADPSSSTLTTDTGTLTFDKVNGTYNLLLDSPISSFTTLETSQGLAFTGYQPNSNATDSTQPAVMVTELSPTFWVQFTGEDGTPLAAGGNSAFTQGETLAAAGSTWVSVSGGSNGVAGDTIQKGEILDFNFFASNPQGFLNHTDITSASTMFLKFDGFNNEDLVVNLKLIDVGADGIAGTADDGATTHLALVVDNSDVFTKASPPPSGFGISLDNNDGVIIIQSNDYLPSLGAGNWQIDGAQVITSTEGLTGSGVNFNGAVGTGATGASSGTEAFGAGTVDNDVVKISDIGLITTTTTTQAADLQFNVSNVDADGDTTAATTLDVQITGNTMTGTAANDVLQSSTADDTMKGNGGNDIFVLQASGGGHDTISDFNAGDSIVVDVASLNLTINTAQSVTFNSGTTGANDQTHNSAFAGSNFFFNTTTNELFYSADNTAAHAVDLAHISTGIPAANAVHVA
ncbi:hypothetical protein JQ631_28105, partial [Bradyrhizobium manausense]|uniref:DUF5801 repeats-in-toxin domain-containing protein n=1 Tax=Bradyrhizobium manausense TaxID=989370 RepID=UPI002012EAAB